MVKVISLSDEAYTKLKSEKLGGSFSDAVIRLADKKPRKSIMDLAGAWKDVSDSEYKEITNAIRRTRSMLDNEFASRGK
ncbi:MAG: antitoxin VapB family protein [Candidatus Diapherotrites archaeon]|uniref:Antitoxin VapB family protein n=1 Tax=Candidatus Iainarchaeum sp. TaxID=3101447 RepID=A0A8T3YN61_9ARCH|nr:antitoxin VapB family protein [Candidatus Diapherotrites archaeon]